LGFNGSFSTNKLYRATKKDYSLLQMKQPLQRVLHAAARFVAAIGPRDHITPTLISLHWLPVRQRITCKLCTMMQSVYYQIKSNLFISGTWPIEHKI